MTATPEQIDHYRQLAREAERNNRGFRRVVAAFLRWASVCPTCDADPCECPR